MKTGKELEQVVYGYWARRFGCERGDFVHAGTLVLREEGLVDTGKVYLYHIDQLSVVRIAPPLAEQAALPEGYDREVGALTARQLQVLIPIEIANTLLDHYLDARDFRCFRAGERFLTRRLDPERDNHHLRSLYQVCTEVELDEAAICVDEPDPVIYGLFANDQLVAYASHRYWEDVIADIGVLIHPDYRGQGLGKAIVSALCEWCLEHDVVPMYRVFSYHAHSRRIPLALGFRELVAVETLKVVKEGNTG